MVERQDKRWTWRMVPEEMGADSGTTKTCTSRAQTRLKIPSFAFRCRCCFAFVSLSGLHVVWLMSCMLSTVSITNTVVLVVSTLLTTFRWCFSCSSKPNTDVWRRLWRYSCGPHKQCASLISNTTASFEASVLGSDAKCVPTPRFMHEHWALIRSCNLRRTINTATVQIIKYIRF